MLWKTDNQATETAREVFPKHLPRVVSNGKRQYLVEPTPFGRVELVGMDHGFVVAAEKPPAGALIDPDRLPERLVGHLNGNGLRPWKVVYSDDCSDVIRALVVAESGRRPAMGEVSIPFVSPITSSAELLGEARQGRCEQLAGLIASGRFPGPLVELVGPDGVGKRTTAAAVARRMDWSLVGELPLARLLVDRVLQTPLETALDTVLAAAASLGAGDLLVVSDAELLELMGKPTCESVLREFARLPHVLLLARPGAVGPDHVVTLECPGLDCAEDARALVEAEYPDIFFAGAALELAIRAATVPGVGLIPGRLLYLVRLAKALRPADVVERLRASELGVDTDRKERTEGEEIVLSPDEISSATTLALPVWADDSREG